eukprot:GHVU01214846.1.p1 GENE.GHVU01214846.1~~GHVU01214846.1.p1  ORF type:complete len:182 (-),score=19.73 GHVU01214846.1:253-798(-)
MMKYPNIRDATEKLDVNLCKDYDAVVVHIGTNDIRGRPAGVVTAASDYEQLIKIVAHDVPVVISTLTQVDDEQENLMTNTFNQLLKLNLAANDTIEFVDYEKIDLEQDGVHVSRKGTPKLVAKLKEAIRRVLPALAWNMSPRRPRDERRTDAAKKDDPRKDPWPNQHAAELKSLLQPKTNT